MLNTGELKRGLTIELDGQLYQVIDFQHIKMGRGSAQVRIKLKDLKAGHTIEKSVQAGEKFIHVPFYMNNGDTVKVDTRTGEFLSRVVG